MKMLSFIGYYHYFRSLNENLMNTKILKANMLKRLNPTKTQAWSNLQEHFEEMQAQKMQHLFESNSARFEKFSIQLHHLH